MSTRCITHIHEMKTLDPNEHIVCSFYRHWDGYPSGHGRDLYEWLKDKGLKNGIGLDFREGKDFNRAGSMAVKLMNHIYNISGCEVIPTGAKNYGEEFTYHIYFRDDKFIIICRDEWEEEEFVIDENRIKEDEEVEE